MKHSPEYSVRVLLPVLFSLLLAIAPVTLFAKLTSSSMEELRCKNIIDDLLRRTRLNDDDGFWGDRYKEDIVRTTKMLSTNYYQIFSDMGISKAMARCVVNARNESDYQRWLRQMDEFDRGAAELNRKDRGRYHFAKGLVILQSVPKVQLLPNDFYKAAECGYSSSFLAEYITPGSNDVTTHTNGYNIADALQKLAESYRRGNELKEAYKFYLLANKYGTLKSTFFLKMVECAHLGGNDSLALISGHMFLNSFPLTSTGEYGVTGSLDYLPVSAGMSADDLWRFCTATPLPAIKTKSDSLTTAPIEERILSRFDGQLIQPMVKNMGEHGDFFEASICELYWSDSLVVMRYIPRISGPITTPYIATLATAIRQDQRFSANVDCAVWEAKRWKEAGKLDEFASQYPQRYKLAAMQSKE